MKTKTIWKSIGETRIIHVKDENTPYEDQLLQINQKKTKKKNR